MLVVATPVLVVVPEYVKNENVNRLRVAGVPIQRP